MNNNSNKKRALKRKNKSIQPKEENVITPVDQVDVVHVNDVVKDKESVDVIVESADVVVENNGTKSSKKRKLSVSDDENDLPKATKHFKANKENCEVKLLKIKSELKTKKKVKVEQKKQGLKQKLELMTNKMMSVKEMFLDTPQITDPSIQQMISERLVQRMTRTIVVNNCPHQFTAADARALVPEMVSCIIPYNFYYHKVEGAAYIDVASSEIAAEVVKNLHKQEFQSRKISMKVQTKITDDVKKYNCHRLVISNLSIKTTEAELKVALPTAVRVEIMPTKGNDFKSTKTAFAEYSRVEDAIADYDSKHGLIMHEHPINVKFQVRQVDNVKTKLSNFDKKRLKVFGLKTNTPLNDLKKTFPQAISIEPALDKGTAMIIYSNEDECYVDKLNSNAAKIDKKWRISYAPGNVIVSEKEEMKEVEMEVKDVKVERKKFTGKKFVGKKFRGKGIF